MALGAWAQNPIYVTLDGAGSRNGSSWTDALSGSALQGTLASAPSGTTVLVASGLYKPTTIANRNISFSISSGVQVYGGYTAGTNIRTTSPSSTTFAGDIDNDNTLAGNTYRVVQSTGTSVVVDGLVITQGDARPLGEFPNASGGGLYQNGGSLTVRNVTFTGNTARDGGGMFVQSGSADVINCTFSRNTTTGGTGAGLYYRSSTGNVTNCIFKENSTSVLTRYN